MSGGWTDALLHHRGQEPVPTQVDPKPLSDISGGSVFGFGYLGVTEEAYDLLFEDRA